MGKFSVFSAFLGIVLQFFLVQHGFCTVGLPEFMEPIKNMTTHEGSNVELSCYVKHLQNYRIMWLKKEGEKEVFVAINLLKITKNPRVTISLLQTSDDITQSNVYIHNVEIEDTGAYECAVNTNPMISQIGTLEVVATGADASNHYKEPVTELKDTLDSNKDFEFDQDTLHSNTTENLEAGNGTVCFDMNKFWEDATDNIKDFVKSVLKSVVDFTCSLLN